MVVIGVDLWRPSAEGREERRLTRFSRTTSLDPKVLTLLTPLREDEQLEQAIAIQT